MLLPNLLTALWLGLSLLAYALSLRQRSSHEVMLWAGLAAFCFFFGIRDFIPGLLARVPQVAQVPQVPQVVVPRNVATTSWEQVSALHPAVAGWQSEIETAATICGVEPMLVAAVMTQESKGDPNICSNMGACGLMQLMPGTAQDMNVANRFSPAQNVLGGTCYLRRMLDRYHQDLDISLAAYNAGPGNVDDYGGVPPFAETQKYIRNVRGFYAQYTASAPQAAALGEFTGFSHLPMNGYVLTRAYGVPITYQRAGYHTGLDLGIGIDDGLYAVGDGVIEYVGPLYCNLPGKCRGPYSIVLRLASDVYVTYSHNKEVFVTAGQVVAGGQRIATVGSLGYSSDPHLHFELCEGCTWTGNWVEPFSPEYFVDPSPYLPNSQGNS